jgi:hypothetical protein
MYWKCTLYTKTLRGTYIEFAGNIPGGAWRVAETIWEIHVVEKKYCKLSEAVISSLSLVVD